jgi:cytochrome b
MAIARGSAFVRGVFLAVVGLLIARLAWDLISG